MKTKIFKLFVLLIVLGLVICAFWPSLFNGFISWDDNIHLYENESIRQLSWASLKSILTRDVSLTYIPLTSLSFALEYKFFGYDPFVFHLTNLLLHLSVIILVFVIARRLSGSLLIAAVAALLFGIHPMHVESVAWVTERKDVLYAVFYLLAVFFYMNFLSNERKIYYVLALVSGFLSILAKPMALSLPIILLVMDWFYKRPLNVKSIVLKIPFFLFIIPIAWLTYSLNSRAIELRFPESILTWVWTLTFYLKKFAWPGEYLPLYQLPRPVNIGNPEYSLAIVIAVIVLGLLVQFRKNRWLLFAVFYYFASIFFLLRFDNKVDLSIVADRFMYLPSFGFCIVAGVYVKRAWDWVKQRGPNSQIIFSTILVISFIVLGVATFRQTKIWGDEIIFWDKVIAHYPNAYMAYNQRALAYKNKGCLEKSLKDYTRAISLFPRYDYALTNRGIVYKELGQFQEAWDDHTQAIAINPDFSEAYLNRGNVSFSAGDYQGAIADYNKAFINLNGSARRHSTIYRAEVYSRLGAGYFFSYDYDNALMNFDLALKIDPDNIVALDNRAIIFSIRGEKEKALTDFARSLKISPQNPVSYMNRARFYYQNGDYALADQDIRAVLELKPDHQKALELQMIIQKQLKGAL